MTLGCAQWSLRVRVGLKCGTHDDHPAFRQFPRECPQRQVGGGSDPNPIEQAISKLKTLLRKAAGRTVTTTWQRIGKLLDEFTPKECHNYLENSGYIGAT
jgi:hypothetical protein